MTVKKGNFLEFVFIQPVSAGDATTVSGDQTFRVAPATIYKRADGSYYDLNFDNDATISLSQLRGTIVTSDGTVEVVGVSSIASAGTTSDGRRQYDLTFETSSDSSKLLRGMKQDDDGTNAVANRDDDLVIGTVSIGDKFKIAWDVAEANNLIGSFTAASTTATVTAGEALDATSGTLGVSLHTDGKYYKYSGTYTDFQGFLPRGQNIASDAEFTITWLNGAVTTESGLTANTLYYVQYGGTLTTTASTTTKLAGKSRGTTILVGNQDQGIQSLTDGEVEAGTDTVPKLVTAAQLKLVVDTFGSSKAEVVFVQAIGSIISLTTENLSGNTSALVSMVELGQGIDADIMNFYVSAVSAGTPLKIAFYSADGSTKLFEETTGTISTTGGHDFTFSATRSLTAGQYVAAIVPTDGSANITTNAILGYGTAGGVPGSGLAIGGRLTVTAGTLPSSIDMSSLTTPSITSEFIRMRLET